jgi:putative transcriptional regulator
MFKYKIFLRGGKMIKVIIKEILEQKNKTAYWLARETKTSPNAINKLINNDTESISFNTLDKITDVLECDIVDILKKLPE